MIKMSITKSLFTLAKFAAKIPALLDLASLDDASTNRNVSKDMKN